MNERREFREKRENIFFNESRVVNVFAFICLILNTIIAIDIHNMELDIAEYKKERNMI